MEERLFQARAVRPKQGAGPETKTRGPRAHQVVTVFYWKTLIYIFSSQLELNTILPGLKRKTQTKAL